MFWFDETKLLYISVVLGDYIDLLLEIRDVKLFSYGAFHPSFKLLIESWATIFLFLYDELNNTFLFMYVAMLPFCF